MGSRSLKHTICKKTFLYFWGGDTALRPHPSGDGKSYPHSTPQRLNPHDSSAGADPLGSNSKTQRGTQVR